MLKKIVFLLGLMGVTLFSGIAFAGKVELTTYYPEPEGEYKELQASHRLKVPVKTVTNVADVTPGEIWVEPPPPAP